MLYENDEKLHLDTLRGIAPECMVLLAGDGSFPIDRPGMIALYGSGARRTVKGGTGSGDVNVRHFSTIEEGLEKAGFTISTKAWLDAYDTVYENAHKRFIEKIKECANAKGVSPILLGMGQVMPEPEYKLPLSGEGETAIYVLSRVSGEGSDRRMISGDFKLTETEIRDIHVAAAQYSRFLLVLNVGGVVDLGPVIDIGNILLLSQVGMTIGDSFADVLLGRAYPSGKLAATWSRGEDYDQIGDFGKEDDTRYREGIYVGYRYFDSAGIEPLFPFGFGLAYTNFSVGKPSVHLEGSKVHVLVPVKNVGGRPGKEVIQLYVSLPSGELDQPYQTLAAFTKTDELMPGEEQDVFLNYSMEELGSFDAGRCLRILEAGDYVLRLGTSSRDTRIIGVICLSEEVVVERLCHAGGRTDFDDWKPKTIITSASDEPLSVLSFRLTGEDFTPVEKVQEQEREETLWKTLETMSDEELAYLCLGWFKEEDSQSVIGNAGIDVAGAAGETTKRFLDRGIPNLVMADGPAGLRLSRQYKKTETGIFPLSDIIPAAMIDLIDKQLLAILREKTEQSGAGEILEQYCSAIPVGTALAQSWNQKLCESCGDLVGAEMERYGVHLWLAPALNIQRSPLCGRNYEYFSEDPLISGKMAAAITKGVQKHPGCGVTIKHLACNNQETNRYCSNSLVNERPLRDIYLRGFQIAIREAQPYTVMTSYNLLNGEHTSQRRDLLTQVLRGEWGFQGVVMSDWVISGIQTDGHWYPYACASGSLRAGNDIMMPGSEEDYQDLMNALASHFHQHHLTREHLLACAYRISALAITLTSERA